MAEKLIFATSNQGKLREIRLILGDLGMEVISMVEADLRRALGERKDVCGKRSYQGQSSVGENRRAGSGG